MRRLTKKYLVPHEGNNFVPHILRARSMAVLFTLVIALFAYSGAREYLFLASDWGAEVLSSVLVGLTNNDRTNLQLPELRVNQMLVRAAQMKADDMVAKGYFAHTSPDGSAPWHWFGLAGYEFDYAGENLAINFTESNDVERAWMESPTHRSNILSGYFSEIGAATAQGYYNGKPTIFVVQMFGKPRSFRSSVVSVAHAEEDVAVKSEPPKESVLGKSVNLEVPEVSEAPTPKPQEPEVILKTDTIIAVRWQEDPVAKDVPINVVDPVRSSPPQRPSGRASAGATSNGVDEAGATDGVGSKQISHRADVQASQDRLSLPSGNRALHYAYFIIAFLLLVPLILLFRHKLKSHHYPHVSYGVALLSVMSFLLIIFDLVILPSGFIL